MTDHYCLTLPRWAGPGTHYAKLANWRWLELVDMASDVLVAGVALCVPLAAAPGATTDKCWCGRSVRPAKNLSVTEREQTE